MTMDFEDLHVFLAAAEHQSFGRAASALGLAQPSVSNRIASVGANDRPAALQTVGPWGDCHARRSAAHSTRSSRTPDHRGRGVGRADH